MKVAANIPVCNFNVFRKVFITFILLLAITIQVSAQKNDTLDIYNRIKKHAYKRKSTTLLYHAVFVDPAPKKYENQPLSDEQRKENQNLKYEGKIIRNIEIIAFDPFGYSVNDTSLKTINPLQKIGNHYHIITRKRIIKNLLLFNANEPLEALKLNESERVLRQMQYINDARIYVNPCLNSDSVDIKVMVLDKWNIDVPASISTTGGRITLRNKNFLGLGQRYEQMGAYQLSGDYQLSGRNRIENIGKSFVSSDVFYNTNNKFTQIGIAFDRPFYSPLAKWAGGVATNNTFSNFVFTDSSDVVEKYKVNYYSSDAWAAKNAHPIIGKRINRKVSNLTIAFRHAQTYYGQRPSSSVDTTGIYQNAQMYLGSVGFALSKFYKDQYIFRFGANEDIPEGLIIQFTTGYYNKELTGLKQYIGFDISRGKHLKKVGYLSGSISYGSLLDFISKDNATLNMGVTYFTDLLQSKRWYFRQFLYLKYTDGFNKPENEKITFNSKELYGFESNMLNGKTKLVLNLESVTYMPYNIIGFKFAPVVLVGFGALDNNYANLLKGKVYQAYSVGFMIRNENLLNNSFKITYGFYPNMPNSEGKNYKLNPNLSISLKVHSFLFYKPYMVAYE